MGNGGKYWSVHTPHGEDAGKYWECAHSPHWGCWEVLGECTLLTGNAGKYWECALLMGDAGKY